MKTWRVLLWATLLVLCMGTVSAQSSEELHFRFNESSSPAYDFSGNNRDGSWSGDIRSGKTGITGTGFGDGLAYEFDPDDNPETAVVDLPTDFNLFDGTQSFSISAWVNPYSYPPSDDPSNGHPVFEFRGERNLIIIMGDNGPTDKVNVRRQNTNNNWETLVSTNKVDLNQYDFVTITYDPSNGWKMYQDGSLVGSSSNTQNIASNNDADKQNIGGDTTTSTRQWNGKIDEPRIFSKTLSSSEVENLYNCNQLSSCNTAPSIDSVSTTPQSWTLGSDVDVSADVVDGDGTVSSVSVDVSEDGSKIVSDASLTNTGGDTWGATDLFNVDESGVEYELELTATDDDGATTTYTTSQVIEDSSTGLSVSDPVQGELYNSQTVPYSLQLQDDGDDVPGESATCDLKLDGSTFTTVYLTEGGSGASGTFDVGSDGDYTFSTSCSEDEGDPALDDVSRSFTVDTGAPSIQILNPVNRTNSTTGISLEYTVSDPNLDTSSCKYSKDGGTNISISNCGNTTIQYSQIGTHSVTVYVSDSVGNTGKDSSTFEVDILNNLTVENQETNTALKNYTATITNGTNTIGGFQTEKVFQFFTGELPKADINATVTKDGFQGETQKFTGVDNTFNQDINFQLERSGLNIQVLDEQTNSKLLGPKKIEISNNTDTLEYFYGNNYIGQDFGPEVADNDLSTKTGFGESDNNDNKKRTARVSVSLGQSSNEEIQIKHSFQDVNVGCSRAVHTHLNKVQAETDTGSFNTVFSSGPGSGNQGVKTTTVTLDNSNGKYTGLLKVQGLIDGDDSCVTDDFNLFEVFANNLTNLDRNFPNYPTGNVEIQVDDNFNDQYRSRSVETTLDSTTKLNLDAYLLERGQGIFTTVEVLENEQDQLKDAEVRIRRNFDGDFKTVATDRTATDGTAGFFLDPDTQYQASISKTGFQTFQGTFSPVNYQADPFKVALGKEGDFLRSNVYDSVKFKIQPRSQSVNKTVTEFNFTVSDLEAQISDLGINLSNGDTKAISGTPTGGTVLLESNLTDSNLSDLELTAFFVKDGERYNIERTYNLRDPVNPGIASITNVAGKLSSLGNTTRSLLAVLLTGFVAFSLKSRINRKGGSLVTLSSLGIFVLIGWLPAFYWLLTLLTVIGLLAMR